MGNPLKTPPVYLTLAQVRFNPILKLPQFVEQIQENFRLAGYGDFSEQQFVSIHLTSQAGQNPTPTPVTQQRFHFGNLERTHIFGLTDRSITLYSSRYGHFDTFLKCFLEGLATVHHALDLAFTETIGLRYLDLVVPKTGEALEDYLVEQVRGLGTPLGGESVYSYAEAMDKIGNITLRSRVAIQNGPFAFPPDLQRMNLHIEERFNSHVGHAANLDNDGFVEVREPFSAAVVAEHLKAIHMVISHGFKSTVTPHALEVWNE